MPRSTASTCPSCKTSLDAATCPTNPTTRPNAGDISICFYCGEPLCFNADLTVRTATVAELIALGPEGNRQFDKLQKSIREHPGRKRQH